MEISARLRGLLTTLDHNAGGTCKNHSDLFYKRCCQVFTSAQPVRWTHLAILTCTLTTENFRPESVVVPGGFQYIRGPYTGRLGIKTRAHLQDNGDRGNRTIQNTKKTPVKEAINNPAPILSLQVGMGFNLWLSTGVVPAQNEKF